MKITPSKYQKTIFETFQKTKQNIAIKANPYGDDLVIPIEYDNFGRQTKKNLPMPIATKNGEIQTGINEASVSSYYNVTNAYSEKVLDDLLQRPHRLRVKDVLQHMRRVLAEENIKVIICFSIFHIMFILP